MCACGVQAFLLNEDLGDSLDSVEALLKKHEDFEKSLSAQEEKITVSGASTPAAFSLASLFPLERFRNGLSVLVLLVSRPWMSSPPN